MDADRWRRLRPLLDQALDLDGAARAEFLDDLAGDDPGLHAELDELLRQNEAPAAALDAGAAALAAPALEPPDPSVAGQTIGRYRVEKLLGSGGMGAVYLAERVDGEFEQQVALKVIRGALGSPGARERFVQERQILAQLAHPNIARLTDGGETDAGEPYFTLEYVDGVPITEYCASHALAPDARIKLLIKVASALAYAHRNLVVHRDIKPSNILVEADGRVRLLDFGIAKLVGDDARATLTRQPIGPMTPEYAAPEQFRRGAISVATDVYQFGVLLFRLLTGRFPYRADPDDPLTWARAVTEEEPLTLSRALTLQDGADTPALREHVARDAGALRRARKHLGGDLNAIVQKCLAKSPDARYASMDALIADLDAFLAGRTVSARRASRWYSTRRFVARHRAAVAFGALALIAIVAAAAVAAWQAVEARRAAAVARVEAQNAEQTSQFLTKLFTVSDPGENRGARLSANDILEQGAKKLDTELADNPLQRGRLAFTIGSVYMQMGEYRRAGEVLDHAIDWLAAGGADAVERSKALRNRAYVASRAADFDLALGRLAGATVLLEGRDDHAAALERALVRGTRATVLHSLGKLEPAVEEFRAAISVTVALEGANSSKLAALYNNLAITLQEDGKLEAAIAAFRSAVEVYQASYGADHPRTLGTSANLAAALSEAGQHDRAIALASRVVDVDRRVYGGKGPQFGNDLNALGIVQFNAGRFAAALAAFDNAAQTFAETGGSQQETYAQAIANRASCLLQSGDARHALESAQRALKIRIDVLGPEHRNTRQSHAQLAQVYVALERKKEALDQARLASSDLEKQDAALRAITLRALALAESANGKADAAREHATRGLEAVGTRPMLAPEDAQLLADLKRFAAQ